MSIHCMSTVWRESKAEGTALLLELAIADHARDSGWAWPGIESLAKKTRMSVRAVQYIIRDLEEMGELAVETQTGPKGTNMYLLLLVTKGTITDSAHEFDSDKKLSSIRTALRTKENEDVVVESIKGGAESAPVQNLQGAKLVSVLHPNHKEPTRESTEPAEWPSEEEVLKFAHAYPGNPAKMIPAMIPEPWARHHWHIRTYDKRDWAPAWRQAMVSLFENQWVDGYGEARGANGVRIKSRREPGEILQEMELARKRGEPTDHLKQEYRAVTEK